MTKTKQVHDLINTLRERTHVVEFAEKCAERAESYAAASDYAAEAAYAAYAAADYAAASHANASAANAADYAAAAAAAADYANAANAAATERDLQITHLKELHVREESRGL